MVSRRSFSTIELVDFATRVRCRSRVRATCYVGDAPVCDVIGVELGNPNQGFRVVEHFSNAAPRRVLHIECATHAKLPGGVEPEVAWRECERQKSARADVGMIGFLCVSMSLWPRDH